MLLPGGAMLVPGGAMLVPGGAIIVPGGAILVPGEGPGSDCWPPWSWPPGGEVSPQTARTGSPHSQSWVCSV